MSARILAKSAIADSALPEMAKRRRSPDEIRLLLDQTLAAIAAGQSVTEACAGIGISEANYYRWRADRARGKGKSRSQARTRSRAEIIAAAKAVFLREGHAVGLDGVAAAANVTRQTLYNLFGSKERLFRLVVLAIWERILDPILHIDSQKDIRETLMVYGRQLMSVGLDPEGMAGERLILTEYRDFPDLGATLYETVTRNTPVLTTYFQSQIDAGRLRPFDTLVAAEAFIGALTLHSRYRALIGVGMDPQERQEKLLHFVVGAFCDGIAIEA